MGKSVNNGAGPNNAMGPASPWANTPGGNPNTTHWDYTIGRNPAE